MQVPPPGPEGIEPLPDAPAGDEERFPTGPNGRLETRAEMEHRLAVNCKMRVHRSLNSSLYAFVGKSRVKTIPNQELPSPTSYSLGSKCPEAVLERAKGRRHSALA